MEELLGHVTELSLVEDRLVVNFADVFNMIAEPIEVASATR
jgi:hypothetical protein